MKLFFSHQQRRDFNQGLARQCWQWLALGAYSSMLTPAQALSLGDLSASDASAGIKAALERGAVAAVGLLGKPDGFLGNPKVKIPLPSHLADAARMLRSLGMADQVDEVLVKMNRAAEQAVPHAKDLLVGAIKSMSLADAKNILTGGEGSATRFFSEKTRQPMGEKFLPIVSEAIQKVGLLDQYNRVAAQLLRFGLLRPESANIQVYVTSKALDSVFLMISEEEKNIRQDPIATGSALLKKVFSAL
jgi:Protein of unknown function (DUF4197)